MKHYLAAPSPPPQSSHSPIEKPPLRYAFNAAIMEQHKAGMSGRKISELFNMGQRTVSDIIAAVRENPESGKPLTQSSPSCLPLANTEDRVLMMNKLIQMDEKRFMRNPFKVNSKEVMIALQITTSQANTAIGPKNKELEVKRDAAILELHKGGMSGNAISKALGIGQSTVSDAIRSLTGNSIVENPVAPSALPPGKHRRPPRNPCRRRRVRG